MMPEKSSCWCWHCNAHALFCIQSNCQIEQAISHRQDRMRIRFCEAFVCGVFSMCHCWNSPFEDEPSWPIPGHSDSQKKKTKYLFYFTLDEALQPSRLSRRSHADRSRWSCDSRSYPGVAMLNVITLKWWEMLSKQEGGQGKSRVVDSRLSGGKSLSPVLFKKGWVDGGANNVQEAWLESTMGINLWSPATSYPISICVAYSFLMTFSQLLIHARWQKSGQCMHSSSGVWNSHLMSSGTASANV